MADVAAPSIAANVIITPDMVPPPAEPLEAQAAQYKTLADQVSDLAQQLRAANAMREDAAQSPGWDVGHEKIASSPPTTDAWPASTPLQRNTLRGSLGSTATPKGPNAAWLTEQIKSSRRQKTQSSSRRSSRAGTRMRVPSQPAQSGQRPLGPQSSRKLPVPILRP
ncbi:hypothetical protein MJO63_26305 (plasmid) [Mycobacterium ulcerans]|uniref:Uncharacterized protein n=1 Tax=Mycobacterium ulcerans TaxID=1809 RepID=A0ABY5TUH0_MYCUL|nr:hypothetical protein MJO63_26305 [Mycobacterium ulcerans]